MIDGKPATSTPRDSIHQSDSNSSVINSVNLAYSTVGLSINNVKLHALVDTGAALSCIRLIDYQRVSKSGRFPLQTCTKASLSGPDGRALNVVGCCMLILCMGSLTITHKFYVIEDLQQAVILGLDFLTDHSGSVDIANHKLVLHNGLSAEQFLLPCRPGSSLCNTE